MCCSVRRLRCSRFLRPEAVSFFHGFRGRPRLPGSLTGFGKATCNAVIACSFGSRWRRFCKPAFEIMSSASRGRPRFLGAAPSGLRGMPRRVTKSASEGTNGEREARAAQLGRPYERARTELN